MEKSDEVIASQPKIDHVVCKALSDETRLAIVYLLLKNPDGMSGTDIRSNLVEHGRGVAQSKVSKHLSILSNAGVITTERTGKSKLHRINTEVFQTMALAFGNAANSVLKPDRG